MTSMPLCSILWRCVVFASLLIRSASAQTWCGKNYMKNETASSTPIPGQFSTPASSSSPLLALRCAPAIKPFLASDASASSDVIPVAAVVDTRVVYTQVPGAQAVSLSSSGVSEATLDVTVTVNGTKVGSASVPLNTTDTLIPLSLSSLSPQTTPYTLSCSAALSSSSQTFSASDELMYLPDPQAGEGSVTRMDTRTGALIARPPNGQGDWERVFPVGFYTFPWTYLSQNLSIVDELKAQGFNVVHPVPPFDDDLDGFDKLLDRMEQAGLYLMYDMRFTYMNQSAVTEEVNRIKSRSNLLLWYSSDEPDGTSDPLNATTTAQSQILSLDEHRHPVSLVLNCQDYHFADYAAGAQVLMQDAYVVSNNVTFSSEWGTPCNATYGVCGCDNCVPEGTNQAAYGNVASRMEEFRERVGAMGWERGRAVWGVPQAFGDSQYWPRVPTGREYMVQALVSINHGAAGLVAWNDPTPSDIKSAASTLALQLPQLTPFLLAPNASYTLLSSTPSAAIDAALWTSGTRALLVATNTQYTTTSMSLSSVPGYTGGAVQQVLDSGAQAGGGNVSFESVGGGAWVLDVQPPVGGGVNTQNSAARRSVRVLWLMLVAWLAWAVVL